MNCPRPEELNILHATICRAVADPKRILILYALDQEPRHVSALARDLSIPQPTVSRHLAVLRRQSLVTAERNGPSMVYSVADNRVIDVLNTMQALMYQALDYETESKELQSVPVKVAI